MKLANVRSIKSAELRFQPGFNLLVGENGVGKTSVLEMLADCLDRYVRVYNHDTRNRRLPYDDQNMIRMDAEALDVECGFLRGGTQYRFVMHMPRGRSNERQGRIGFVGNQPPMDPEVFERAPYKDGGASEGRPLGVKYSTIRSVPSEAWPRSAVGGISRAYEDALEDREVRLGYFASWMEVMRELERAGSLLRALENAVRSFLPGYGNLRLGGRGDRRLLVDREGRGWTLGIGQLSHGERGIFAVVLDLTRRLGQANPGLKDPAAEAGAVVLIDEIDLHLHPKWQREIPHKLTRAFPRCQFIATTHSPQVIGEVEADRIQIISDDETYSPTHSFGVDSSRVLEEVMEADPRNSEVKDLLSRASRSIDRERFEEARELLGRLDDRLGENDPDVTGLRTLLAFMEGGD